MAKAITVAIGTTTGTRMATRSHDRRCEKQFRLAAGSDHTSSGQLLPPQGTTLPATEPPCRGCLLGQEIERMLGQRTRRRSVLLDGPDVESLGVAWEGNDPLTGPQ